MTDQTHPRRRWYAPALTRDLLRRQRRRRDRERRHHATVVGPPMAGLNPADAVLLVVRPR